MNHIRHFCLHPKSQVVNRSKRRNFLSPKPQIGSVKRIKRFLSLNDRQLQGAQKAMILKTSHGQEGGAITRSKAKESQQSPEPPSQTFTKKRIRKTNLTRVTQPGIEPAKTSPQTQSPHDGTRADGEGKGPQSLPDDEGQTITNPKENHENKPFD